MHGIDNELVEQGLAAVELATMLGRHLESAGQSIATAESCTGGLIAAAITEVAGSSAWFQRGLVTYSNHAKRDLLGVSADVFDRHGAVSEACVKAMALGAMRHSGADVAVSVSGIAGPGGATPGKPVGTVWIAWAIGNSSSSGHADFFANASDDALAEASVFQFSGNRHAIREQAVIEALRGTLLRIDTAGYSGL